MMNKEIQTQYDDIESLMRACLHGKISQDDVSEYLLDMKKTILKRHEAFCKIWQASDGRWKTKVPDRTKKNGCRLIAKSKKEDIEKYIIEYYQKHEHISGKNSQVCSYGKSVVTDFSFKAMFEVALKEKTETDGIKEKTIRDYRSSYKAFISDELGARDIRYITPSEVKKYIQDISKSLAPTKKRFYKLKGVLNLVFDYASDTERRYVEINPVPSKNAPYKKNYTPSAHKPEDKAFQPHEIEKIRDYLWERVNKCKYDVNGYAILFSSETGVREAEIPALKWEDIRINSIHVHAQQNDEIRDGKKVYYYNPSTKNEKSESKDGRLIPLTDCIREILDELKAKQDTLGIKSEWVFCKKDGSWITTVAYYEALYKVCKKLNLKLSNNHAFRIALNSYVYIPMGINVSERARILGHSVETNLKYYTFARTEEHIDELCNKINAFDKENRKRSKCNQCNSNIIDFRVNRKSLESAKTQAFP